MKKLDLILLGLKDSLGGNPQTPKAYWLEEKVQQFGQMGKECSPHNNDFLPTPMVSFLLPRMAEFSATPMNEFLATPMGEFVPGMVCEFLATPMG